MTIISRQLEWPVWLSDGGVLDHLFHANAEFILLAFALWLFIMVGRPRWHRMLALFWLVVLTKPLVVLLLGTPYSVFEVLPAREGVAPVFPQFFGSSAPWLEQSIEAVSPGEEENTLEVSASASAAPNTPLLHDSRRAWFPKLALDDVLCWFWVAGSLSLAAFSLLQKWRIHRILLRALPPDERLAAEYAAAARRIGVARPPKLLVTDAFDSPAIAGILRPTILMPRWLAIKMDAPELDWSLRHELMHWKLGDPFGHLIRQLTQVLFFYNPVAWWAGRRWETHMELACDRALLQTENDAEEYARQLFALLMQVGARRYGRLTGGLFATRTQIGRRIAMLTDRPLRFRAALTFPMRTLAAGLSVAVLSVGGIAFVHETSAATGKTLHFPASEIPFGALYIRASHAEPNTAWSSYGDAVDSVTIPYGHDVQLWVAAGTENLEPLQSMLPGDLHSLILSHAQVDPGQLANLSHLSGLRELNLDGTEVPESELKYLTDLTSLQSLRTGRPPIGAPGLGYLSRLPNLRFLRIWELAHPDTRVTLPARFDSLQEFHVRNGDATGMTAEECRWLLQYMPNLVCLNLSRKPDPNMGNDLLASYNTLSTLQVLRVSSPKVNDSGLEQMTNLPQLRVLDASRTGIEGPGLYALSRSPLTHLSLADTPITDEKLAPVSLLADLRYLDLSHTNVGDAGLAHLVNLTNLETLLLDSTQVSDAGMQFLSGLPRLQRLSCHGTAVTPVGIGAARQAVEPGLRIGVLFSHYSAAYAKPYMHWQSQSLAAQLIAHDFEVYAIVEPGTAELEEMQRALVRQSLTDRIIDGSDAYALAQLDVIALRMRYNLRDEVIDAIKEAVTDGVGLVWIGASGARSMPTDGIGFAGLLGLTHPNYRWAGNNRLFPCAVVKEHPILDGFRFGDLVTVNTLDGYGGAPLDGTPLLALPGILGADFYPLYVRNHGRGRVVVSGFIDFPTSIENATPEEFFQSGEQWREDLIARSCLWAAHRL